MKKILYLLLFVFLGFSAMSQVGINILIPDSSAVLQLESNNKGLGLSRLTTPQRDAIQNPLRGLTIYNTTDSFVEYWNGECWLRVYEKNCNECLFNMSIDDNTDTLDRVVEDSVFSTITIRKIKSTHQINVMYLAVPPPGVNIYFDGPTTVDTFGTLKIVVKADIFAGDGLVPIIIQAFCGDEIRFVSYNVYIEPCVRVTVPMDDYNYDLQADNSTQIPAGSKKCIVMTVNNAVEIHSNDPANPAFTTGNIHPQSKVGIINNGAFLGRGGDGAGFLFSGSLITVGGNQGEQGGDAMQLTARTIIQNNGMIYGGGGGGASVGLLFQTPSIPVIGSIAIGAGMGGGGGSESGVGGPAPNGAITLGIFEPGTDATAGVLSVPGTGGASATTIPIPISVVTINITPSAYGGNGGGYGQQGGSSYIDLQIQVCVAIPIIGNFCFPIPLGGLVPFYGPQGGFPGKAIKRNGNPLTNISDGNYNTNQIKGVVGP